MSASEGIANKVWLNGRITAQGSIDTRDRGFNLGDGLFETIAVIDGAASHFARHLRRLRAGAAVLEIPVPYADSELMAAIDDLLRADPTPVGVMRMTLTRGPAPRGILPPPMSMTPTVLITTAPPPPRQLPAHLILSATTRRNEYSPLSRIKSLNYLDSILARREAQERAADDAIMLNCRGLVAEASAANLFVRLDGRLLTPPVEDGALPGIARAILLESGLAAEQSLTPADLDRAEAMILTNALGVRSAQSFAGRELAPQGRWFDACEALLPGPMDSHRREG